MINSVYFKPINRSLALVPEREQQDSAKEIEKLKSSKSDLVLLGQDVLEVVFRYLSVRDLLVLAGTCRELWARVNEAHIVWKEKTNFLLHVPTALFWEKINQLGKSITPSFSFCLLKRLSDFPFTIKELPAIKKVTSRIPPLKLVDCLTTEKDWHLFLHNPSNTEGSLHNEIIALKPGLETGVNPSAILYLRETSNPASWTTQEQTPVLPNLKAWDRFDALPVTTLRPSIQNLNCLTCVRIVRCNLRYVPESLLSLSSLTHLDLYANSLTELPQGISRLSSLRELNISYNQFRELPQGLSALNSLKELKINYNAIPPFQGFEGFPEVIFSLNSLTKLEMNSNNLQKIPSGLSKLTSLTVLDLSCNGLIEFPREVFHFLPLEILNVSGNPITTTEENQGQAEEGKLWKHRGTQLN